MECPPSPLTLHSEWPLPLWLRWLLLIILHNSGTELSNFLQIAYFVGKGLRGNQRCCCCGGVFLVLDGTSLCWYYLHHWLAMIFAIPFYLENVLGYLVILRVTDALLLVMNCCQFILLKHWSPLEDYIHLRTLSWQFLCCPLPENHLITFRHKFSLFLIPL